MNVLNFFTSDFISEYCDDTYIKYLAWCGLIRYYLHNHSFTVFCRQVSDLMLPCLRLLVVV